MISKQLEIPTIGIGAGVGTDGQILLCHDLLGVFTDFKPKFTKRFANLTEVAVKGITQYIAEVEGRHLPRRRPQLRRRREGVREVPRPGREAQAPLSRRAAEEEIAPAQSLTDRAYADIEEMIVILKLAPGSAISEAELSGHLGIGRTPIREALQRLARERLVHDPAAPRHHRLADRRGARSCACSRCGASSSG